MAYDSREFENYISNNITSESKGSYGFWAAAGGVGVAGAVGASGFIPTKDGKNLWTKYIRGLEHLEGASPYGVFRTFRLSEFLSPFGVPDGVQYSPSKYSHLLSSPAFQDYISKISGVSLSGLEGLGAFEEGLEFRRTGGSLGELRTLKTGRLVKSDVAMLSTGYGPGGGLTAEWFARMSGARKPKSFLTPNVAGEAAIAPGFVPVAAPKGKAQLGARYAHSIASAGVGRLNLLLQSPFQTETFKNLAKKAPFLKRLAPNIKPGTALQMLGRYGLYAGKVGLAVHGLRYLDYLQRTQNSAIDLPRNVVTGGLIGAYLGRSKRGALIGAAAAGILGATPAFDEEGFVGGALNIYSKLRVDLASATSLWRKGAEKTEANFKGITEVKTLAGVAGTGLLLGGAYEQFDRLATVREVYKSTQTGGNKLYEITEDLIKTNRENAAQELFELSKKLEGKEKFLAEAAGRWRGSAGFKKGLVVGAGAFGAMAATGSLVSGDVLGAATVTAGFGGAAYAWAKGRPVLAGLSMLATFALRGKETPEELERIYSGEQLIESKKARFWESGRSRWEGKRPYYRKHRIALMKEHTREKALYGDEEFYWDTDPVFSPISYLTDPYAREKKMWEQGWKFPVTQVPFEDFPIIGPALAATIGRVIKPPKYMGRDQWMAAEGAGDAPPGYENLPAQEPGQKTDIGSTIGNQLYNITEAVGLPGFVIQSLTQRLTGSETLFTKPQLMSPQSVAGLEPSYWSLNLGGMAATSEIVRRFIPKARRDVEQVNPLPSGLPSWLPGPDSNYFLDFSRADVYTKFEEPWSRLPGAGLAAAKFPELKGINPNDYPAYYRYMVLADLAPWSQEYKQYSSFMGQLADSGQLTPDQIMKVQETKKQVLEVKRRSDFDRYKYDMDQVRRETVHITEQVGAGLYLTKEFGKAPISLAGLDLSEGALARIARTESPEISGTEAFRLAEKKKILIQEHIENQIKSGGALDIYVHRDPSMMMKRSAAGPIVPVVAVGQAGQNINRELEQLGLAERQEHDESVLANMAGTNFAERTFGSFWENLMHGMETPLEVFTPIAPTAKFIHQRSPLEDYLRSRIYAREIAMWDKPISHFIAPGLRTVAWWAGWRGLPNEVKQRYMVEEYFDRLEYEKQKRLESSAIAAGQGDVAAQHAAAAQRTMTGANQFSRSQVFLALPKEERKYFNEFVDAPTKREREEIARYVSPQMRTALEAQWLQREVEGAEMRAQAGISTAEDQQMISSYWAKKARIMRRKRKTSKKIVPPANWVGNHPAVEMRDVKLRTVLDQTSLDHHDLGYWDSDVRELERRPYIESVSAAFENQDQGILRFRGAEVMQDFRTHLSMEGEQGYHSYTASLGGNDTVITSPGHNRVNRYLRDPSISTFGY